jgi:DNA processing protein
LGVDAQAHSTALKYKLPTYSWVVGDPASATPHTNRELFRKITHTEGSSIITPHCLYRHRNVGLQPNYWLERNAWIAANSDLLVVIQAKEQSGTWSTVKICHELGITTYAITGSPLDPCYSGNSLMISMSYAHPLSQIEEFTADLKSHLKEYCKNTEKKEGMGNA